jgi:deoxycytidylate deaminase
VTISPCLTCAKLIVNAGISRVVYGGDYTAFLDTVKAMFREAGVKFQSCNRSAVGGRLTRHMSADGNTERTEISRRRGV